MKKNLKVASLAVTAIVSVGSLFSSCVESKKECTQKEITFVANDPKIEIYSSEVQDTVRLMLISDTHLWMSDEREELLRSGQRAFQDQTPNTKAPRQK